MVSVTVIPVSNDELVALYITEEADAFNEGQLKGDVFVPSPNRQRSNRLETSVIRYGHRTLSDMHACGKLWADHFRKSFSGLAQMVVHDIRTVPNLNVDHSPRTWEALHSDIVDWALDDAQYRRQAEKIARKAVFCSVSEV